MDLQVAEWAQTYCGMRMQRGELQMGDTGYSLNPTNLDTVTPAGTACAALRRSISLFR